MAFVHLHNHTEYSLLDGLTHIKDMVRRAAELDMPAVAVTDHGVMSGMVELSDAFVSLPGGLGTFDEFFSVISRVKAGEIEAKSALFDVDDFFAPLAELLDDATARGLNSTDWVLTSLEMQYMRMLPLM